MRCSTFSALAATSLLFSSTIGCRRPAPPTADAPTTKSSPAADAKSATAIARPLTEAARTHPAPSGTLGVDAAETAQAARPSSAPDNLRLGLAYYKVGVWEQAIPALEKAASLAPADATALLHLGYAQMAVGALASAEKTLAKAAALPRISPRDKSDALLERGNCLYAQGDDKAARTAFTQSLAANPKQGMALLALGTLAAQNKQRAEARTFFAHATRDLPAGSGRARAFACLGLLAESEKNAKEARVQYQKALALDTKNAPARDGLARLSAEKPPVKKL